MLIVNVIGEGAHGFELGDVCSESGDFSAPFAELCDGLVQYVLLHIAHDDARSFGKQCANEGFSNASGSTRDHCNLAFEIVHPCLSS